MKMPKTEQSIVSLFYVFLFKQEIICITRVSDISIGIEKFHLEITSFKKIIFLKAVFQIKDCRPLATAYRDLKILV